MRLPTTAVCSKEYKVDWCISCPAGHKVRIHDWNDVAVQVSICGSLIWVEMNEFNEHFYYKK